MVYAIFTFIALGIAGGYFFLGLEHKDLLDEILMSALYFMVFVAGIEIGGNRHIIKKICNPQSILLAVAIPTAVTIGSLGGVMPGADVKADLAKIQEVKEKMEKAQQEKNMDSVE